jgi:hypothetical protein
MRVLMVSATVHVYSQEIHAEKGVDTMGTILRVIEGLGFLGALWLFLLAFVLHEAEEWNITGFEHRNFVGLPLAATEKSARVWIVFICAVGLVWCAVATVSGSPTIAAFVFLPAIAMALGNALQHVYWSFYFRQYAPGIITAVVLLIPLGTYVIATAVHKGYVPMWYVAVWGVLIGFVLVQTVRAGNTMTPFVRAVYKIGNGLSEKLAKSS